MTKFVTATESLVLSPQWPDSPDKLPAIFDAFGRIAAGVENNDVIATRIDDTVLFVARWAPDIAFRAIQILRDGSAMPDLVPREWAGRVSRTVVADYFGAEWRLFDREPDWGAHMVFVDHVPEGEGLLVRAEMATKFPLIDPVRDVAGTDDETLWPVAPRLSGVWHEFLTSWEHVDGLWATKDPGPAWLARRTAKAISPVGRLWWEVRGVRDAGDPKRYVGEWGRSVAITAYLGWPAYLIAAAGRTTPCQACGRVAIQGRTYCDFLECQRARAAERKRRSRAALPGGRA